MVWKGKLLAQTLTLTGDLGVLTQWLCTCVKKTNHAKVNEGKNWILQGPFKSLHESLEGNDRPNKGMKLHVSDECILPGPLVH